jgi:hypothetical protein
MLQLHYSPPSGLRAALAGPKHASGCRLHRLAERVQVRPHAFNLTSLPNERGNFSPYNLARILAAGNDRGTDGDLVWVEIHRGLPSNARDPVGYGANRKQAAAWMRENPNVVIPKLRPLRYDPNDPTAQPEEKGIDVQLALGVIECVLLNRCDVAILFSNDSDLNPVVESVCRLKAPVTSKPRPGVATTTRRGYGRLGAFTTTT